MSDYDDSSFKSFTKNDNTEEQQNSNSNIMDTKYYISKDNTTLNLSKINLSSEEGKSLINNIPKNFPNITHINLNNCNLSSLPIELFSFSQLTALDIRNNKFGNFEKLIEDLSKLNNLTELKIDLDDQKQVLLTLSNLPKLLFLNERPTKGSFSIVDLDSKDIEDITLQNNLDDYNEIVSRLNEKDESHTYADKFQNKLYEEGKKIKNNLKKNVPNYIYANATLKSQLELEKHMAQKYLKYLDEDNSILGNFIFKLIFKTGDKLVDLINGLYPKIEEKTDNLRNELEAAWKAAGEISDFENKYKNLKNVKVILETNIELLQNKIIKLEKENRIISQKLNKKKKDAMQKNDKTNKKIILNSSKNYSDTNSYQNTLFNRRMNSQEYNNNNNNKELKNLKNISYNQNQSYLKPSSNTTYHNNNSYDINNTNNLTHNNIANINDNQQSNNNLNLTLNPNRKPLSIKVAKDIINELYASKANYDRICIENKLPNETLEHYMYIFLNNKYGLKNLVIDWASALINAIKLYSNEDCEINLFGKILRNEKEEDSRHILYKLKTNIDELLEFNFKKKHPLKSKEEVDRFMEQKKNGLLVEEEWKEIIYYLYNPEDSEIIENKILNFIQELRNKLFFLIENGEDVNNDRFITYQNNHKIDRLNLTKKLNVLTDVILTEKKKVTREDLTNLNRIKFEASIPYKDFIEIVCENQIQNRQKYLKNFVNLFRNFDRDGDGVLNEEQFIGLVKAIPYCQNNVEEYKEKFLAIIDPFNHKKFTFNNCVILFSSEIIDENNMTQSYTTQGLSNIESPNIGLNVQSEISLLDKICLGN